MFYRHWRKIALALTGLLWAGCDTESEATCLYGPAPDLKDCAADSLEARSTGKPLCSDTSDIGLVIALYGVRPDLPQRALCYDATAENAAGKAFEIAECDDGEKYLRNPADWNPGTEELPEGVRPCGPTAGSLRASNCVSAGEVRFESDDPRAGCREILDCPEKPAAGDDDGTRP